MDGHEAAKGRSALAGAGAAVLRSTQRTRAAARPSGRRDSVMSAPAWKVQFVCVRAAHHRRRSTVERLCEHFGCVAYCPAGDIGEHDWMPTAADLLGLARVGYVGGRDGAGATAQDERARLDEDAPVLIRA